MSDRERCSQGDLDPHGEHWVRSRDALLAELRERCPVAWSTAHGGFWLVTRAADVRTVLEDWQTFSSAFPGRVAVPPTATDRPPLAPLEVDPPRHDALVALVAPWFGSAAVRPLAEQLRPVARQLLAGGPADLVAGYAVPLVTAAVSRSLRLPTSEAGRWAGWAERVFARRVADPADAAAAGAELRAWVAELLEQRRAQPGDDPLSALATGTVDGAPLEHDEAVGFGVNLLLAGRDATVDGIGNALVHLAEHPEQQARLRAAPQDLPRAVEELLRLYAPISHLGRVVTRATVLAGVRLEPGDVVAPCYGSAGRDEAAFPAAASADLDRRRAAHLSFGAGPHRCLGAQVARSTTVVALAEALAALPPFRLAAVPQPKPNGDTRGWQEVRLAAAEREGP